MTAVISQDVQAIQHIGAVPTILETVSAATGLGFVCIARVTPDSWTACAVLDKLEFGLKVGDGLDVTTTLCEEVRDTGKTVVIDCVNEDPVYCEHHTPRMYGFQSYISIPIFRQDGEYFGTLCGLDPKPVRLSDPATVSTMTLFAQLISVQLEQESRHARTEHSLRDARETAELREQFIAVLGHDVRTPLSAILTGVEVARLQATGVRMQGVLQRIERSARRISAIVDDVVDFTRGRMGGGIVLAMRQQPEIGLVFEQVVSELRDLFPERRIEVSLPDGASLYCDPLRMGQLLSNLLKNALVHGSRDGAVRVTATLADGRFELSVRNPGPRIPDEVLGKLFQPFWRGARKVTGEGLGLGLFIASEIARSHGGAMQVETSDEETAFIYRMEAVAPA